MKKLELNRRKRDHEITLKEKLQEEKEIYMVEVEKVVKAGGSGKW